MHRCGMFPGLRCGHSPLRINPWLPNPAPSWVAIRRNQTREQPRPTTLLNGSGLLRYPGHTRRKPSSPNGRLRSAAGPVAGSHRPVWRFGEPVALRSGREGMVHSVGGVELAQVIRRGQPGLLHGPIVGVVLLGVRIIPQQLLVDRTFDAHAAPMTGTMRTITAASFGGATKATMPDLYTPVPEHLRSGRISTGVCLLVAHCHDRYFCNASQSVIPLTKWGDIDPVASWQVRHYDTDYRSSGLALSRGHYCLTMEANESLPMPDDPLLAYYAEALNRAGHQQGRALGRNLGCIKPPCLRHR